jgi:two-component sensor histidine kinase/ActR/RegA family two-component response regulator
MNKNGSILVVDDSPTNLMLLASTLSADGYQVTPVDSGEAALAEVAARPPDLILLDIRMAGLDGFAVCRRLKAHSETRDIPIMFISGASETAERVEGLELGAVDFISKPVQRAELRARVRTHLELSRLRVEAERHAAQVERSNRLLQQELAERRKAEEALASSLREKDDLLQEVHHRVKNNLALIVSLMRLEAGRSREEETLAMLAQMQARIQSVVLLNEALYKTESYSRVKLADYLRQVATHLFRAQNSNTSAVRLVMDLAPIEVDTKAAIPCGLIVNELMTNSLKHAFAAGCSGEIRVGLRREGQGAVSLQVSDTGPGPPADFGSKPRTSLGLTLVSDLAKQLKGALDIAGANFTITFPSPVS